ncbi:restriction endonuclease [Methylophaga sp.]|uniref:restriction endonuclease n=1 Tax=Methylophaga sp. TaxID=2024840 RepID=UPI003A8FEC24
MGNSNTEYELLVTELYQGMLNFDGYENLRVEHDVVIRGKSGATHQIDVFWEFKFAGVTYRTCVECKNYKRSVTKNQVAAFSAILNDIGNANGIIATTAGYQKGAKSFAASHDIRLVLVNHLLNSVNIELQMNTNHFSNVRFNFVDSSVRAALENKGLREFTYQSIMTGEDFLLSATGEPSVTLNQLVRNRTFLPGQNIINVEDLYHDIEGLGLIEVDSISLDVTPHTYTHESLIEIPNAGKAVLEDILDENVHYLNHDGTVSPSSD